MKKLSKIIYCLGLFSIFLFKQGVYADTVYTYFDYDPRDNFTLYYYIGVATVVFVVLLISIILLVILNKKNKTDKKDIDKKEKK